MVEFLGIKSGDKVEWFMEDPDERGRRFVTMKRVKR